MNKVLLAFGLSLAFLQSGCGIISNLGTPTRHEKKIPAEYDLTQRKEKKLLVLVEQPVWANTGVHIRRYLTDAVNEDLKNKLKWKSKNLITYDELADFRCRQLNFSQLTPQQTGKKLGADLVLLLAIESFRIKPITSTKLHSGSMTTQAALLYTVSGKQLWPTEKDCKNITVSFDVEKGDRKEAADRLAKSTAFCTTRYLYNCPKARFDHFDSFDYKKDTIWQDW